LISSVSSNFAALALTEMNKPLLSNSAKQHAPFMRRQAMEFAGFN
jgi:hypothetical protein